MRPNVLFIVADDLNAWIGALGRNPDVKTPNIDALAARGTLFTHAYCPAPYCNASRMSVFTGCLPTTTGIYHNEPFWGVPRQRKTFIERLRDDDYFTFGAGKVFHGIFNYGEAGRLGQPRANWMEIENRPALWDSFRTNVVDPLPDDRPLNRFFDFANFAAIPPMYHHFDWGPLPDDRIDEMPDALVLREVVDFLRAPQRQPFFCAAGLYKPHLPWHVPARFFELYELEKLSLPLVKDDDLDDVPPIGKRWALTPPDHELITSRNAWRPAVQGYLASISYCDHVVGELLQALRDSEFSDNTIVVLWGDNGFHLGEKLHWRKFALWEEATRVPLIIMNPGSPSRRIHDPVSLIDIFPTLLDLCEVSIDTEIDGLSLHSLVLNGGPAFERPAIMTWGKGNHSLRTSEWRLTRYVDGSEELYDHQIDSREWTNLAEVQSFDDIRVALRRWLPISG